MFVAVYVDEDTLYLMISGIRVDLIRGNTSIQRSIDYLLRKRFRVWSHGVLIFDCRYSYLDSGQFPNEDILWYIARTSASRAELLRALLLWQDKSNDRDEISERYFSELTARVNAML